MDYCKTQSHAYFSSLWLQYYACEQHCREKLLLIPFLPVAVMDYVPCGELLALWKRQGQFPEEVVKIYIAEIAMVLDFLHLEGVIYRDLKMENILLDKDGHVQLTDFGLAKWLPSGERARTICGTLQYMGMYSSYII